MPAPPTSSPDLGPVDQISYVVEDLDRSLPRYEALFGPFDVAEAPLVDCEIRGKRCDVRLKLAINQSGPVETELIQVLEGDTPHSEHLRAHGEGLHHVRFRVDDLDATRVRLEGEGYETLLFKRFGPGLAFAYLETPAPLSSVIELLEMP